MDAELRAMAAISKAIEGLAEPARSRVIAWTKEKWATQIPSIASSVQGVTNRAGLEADAAPHLAKR